MNRRSKATLLVVFFCIFSLTLLPIYIANAETTPEPPAGAETVDEDTTSTARTIDTSAGLRDVGTSTTGKTTGIAKVGNPYGLVARIINVVLSLVGVLFFVLVVYAGFLWMTATGNEERITKAKNIFGGAFIGMFIVLTAYYLVDFVFELLQNSLAT